ncbi:hypothetical protein [Nonomuraea jabiensis]|uniref:Uncharacterized protein n=1 Tax=Nonomuraea jabiensis TaxID=882448 RepID=A0A7W9G729_9ACTN|nr:hypothetical protein [Nonomuraea jabiensis]MBB5778440.1 hypothetical protein [Nonomuraea jabiensis]
MRDPIEPDRQEILSGPGDTRLAEKPRKGTKKTIAIAASALVAVLAAGGVGYMLAANPTGTAQPGGARPAPAQSTAGSEDLGDDDATMGDVTTDAPEGDPAAGAPDDAPDDGSMGDAAPDLGTGDEPTGSDRGTDSAPGGKRPATTSPAKPGPTKSAQPSDGDNPADGPAGELSGQCSKSGC